MIRILSVVLCSVALCGWARAEDKLSLGVKKGHKVSYSSQRTSDVKFERDGETNEMKSGSSAQFTLSVKNVAEDGKITFNELQDIVGFPAYYEAERKYVAD